MRAQLAAVVSRVDELNERVNAQFTSISAHAEISREQMSEVREEARADMERSRQMLLDLIDRLRDERYDDETDIDEHVSAVSTTQVTARDQRLDALEERLADLAGTLEQCERRQRHIAETMSDFIDTMMNQQRDERVDDRSDDRPVRLVLA